MKEEEFRLIAIEDLIRDAQRSEEEKSTEIEIENIALFDNNEGIIGGEI